MKNKRYWLIGAVILGVMLTGCKKEEAVVDQDIYYGSTDITANGYGVYFWEENQMNFYDFNTENQVLLCNKPQCSHKEETCIANMLPPEGIDGELQAFIADNEHWYGVYCDGIEMGLVESKLDGTERKVLTTFQGVLPTKLWKYENTILIAYSEAEMSEDKMSVQSGGERIGAYSLDNSKFQVIPNKENEELVISGIIGLQEGNVYYAYRVLDSKNPEIRNNYFGIYNIKTGQCKEKDTKTVCAKYVNGTTVYGVENNEKDIYQWQIEKEEDMKLVHTMEHAEKGATIYDWNEKEIRYRELGGSSYRYRFSDDQEEEIQYQSKEPVVTVTKHLDCTKGVIVKVFWKKIGMECGLLTNEQYEQNEIELMATFGSPKKMMQKVEE